MEQVQPKRRKIAVYFCLAFCLLLTFATIVLVLAKGFDSRNFLESATWPLAALPASLAVPLFVAFDFFARVNHPEDPEILCPIAAEGSGKGRRFAFLYATFASIAALLLFFLFNENKDVPSDKICLVFLIPSLPTLFIYVYPLIRSLFQAKKESEGAFCVAILVLAAAAAALLAYGLLNGQTAYLFAYAAYPVCAIMLMMYKRED